jgi:hypothetical protein
MQKLWPVEVCCRKLSKTDETVQIGLESDWTSRNGSNRLGCGFDFFFFALLSSILLAETFWNSDQVTTRIRSAKMENKSRKTKGCMAVGITESVVAVVAVVMAVTRTRNSKELDVKPALDITMQTRIQQCKY